MQSSSFTSINDDSLIRLIQSATQRLIIVTPGLSLSVARAIQERWRMLGASSVKITLDIDPEVSRLGYGTLEGLELLQATAAELKTLITHQPGIRVGVIIVDDKTIIYAPTPLLIEAGTTQSEHPNAVTLFSAPLNILEDLGQSESGVQSQTIGLDTVTPKQIEQVKNDLHKNPPVKFDIARIVRVFSTQFEFVEFELKGGRLQQKRVPISSDLMGLARDDKTKRLLKSSFRLVDETGPFSANSVSKLKEYITKRYLISLQGYGSVILRSNKDDFEVAVKTLRKWVMRFQRQTRSKLENEIKANRDTLANALWPSVRDNWPSRWQKYLGKQPKEQDIRRMLDEELSNVFGSAQDILEEIEVKLLYKGVTYELLNDPKFIKVARQKIQHLKTLHEEYDAARTAKP
ncbi:MAG: hypothetical protein B6D41_00170 [Chloroflexi bacterium UTCFX4]|jgi:hypothetical protein|nr:MAG: hypothetical protein B6D41_00170 [Chloroflexi bacterium UTCFX4]